MIDYDKWADEYLSNALATKRLIEDYKERRKTSKSKELRLYYDRKIITLYDMYDDCVYAARELRKRADRIRQRS